MADVELRPIRRLLVANRGEIARRILRTAHRMGIATVAVYADGDAGAPFVREADTAVALEGRTSAQTYLDVGKVLAACERTGADAVHPGYGFLSENAAFAQAVIARGLTWVGPSPQAIGQIGDKLAAKRLVRQIGVPTLEAFELAENADAHAAAERIGYPVLIKAAAGGGGKGMRIVETPAELADAIAGARREATAAFGELLRTIVDPGRYPALFRAVEGGAFAPVEGELYAPLDFGLQLMLDGIERLIGA